MSQDATTLEDMIRAPISLDAAVRINQLPEIEDQLREIREWVVELVETVKNFECTEENLQEAKVNRAFLNKLLAEFNKKNKEILDEVEAPIKRYKATYKECISEVITEAHTSFGREIHRIEGGMKGPCETRLRAYFDELTQVSGLDFLKYEQAGIVVSMADARAKTQPTKKLREQAEKFVLRVANDVDMIHELKNASEVLAAYKESLNVTGAIQTVNERHRKIEQAQAEQERRNAVKAQEAEARQKVEAFAPPTVSETEKVEDLLTCTFTITDSRERLKLLKQFLDATGYKYTS